MDQSNLNPQNKNAQALLCRWDRPHVTINSIAYSPPNPLVISNSQVNITILWRRHLWKTHLVVNYLRPTDIVFYPGSDWPDLLAIRLRNRLGKKVPIIATLEGLLGNEQLEREYASWAGHEVYCQRVSDRSLARSDFLLCHADHVIAISPFLADMGRRRFGDKFSVIPLGIETSIFHDHDRSPAPRMRVVSVGRVDAHKRPEIMLQLARIHSQADFVWIGDGAQRQMLIQLAARHHLANIQFPGALQPQELASCLRNADIFVMPSKSEGVPKVTQEAAACGLAQVVFGFYETPSVINRKNGFVVWDDQDFFERVDQLLNDRDLTKTFGIAGAMLAREAWNWDLVANQWQDRICEWLSS